MATLVSSVQLCMCESLQSLEICPSPPAFFWKHTFYVQLCIQCFVFTVDFSAYDLSNHISWLLSSGRTV